MGINFKKLNVKALVVIGVMAAFCFVSNYFSIKIPTPIGTSRVHFGNIFCVLSGLTLGPIGGGLSAGIGAFFFDLFSEYAAEAPITLVTKFMLAFVTGLVAQLAYKLKPSHVGDIVSLEGVVTARMMRFRSPRIYNMMGAIAGSLTYVVLYMAKTAVTLSFFSLNDQGLPYPADAVWATTLSKGGVSLINAVIAVVCASLLFPPIKAALMHTAIGRELALQPKTYDTSPAAEK
ncbi:MAG: ECF transporter S component [Oscillospiraceae bacterium]|nr:ECF transporter S component [Oscillospiraceae bacterium]